MKTLLLTLLLLLTITAAWAQVPQQISYQSVIRDGNNKVIASSTVGIKISLLQGSATGAAVYVETHSKTTNANGLVSLEIGTGTVLSGSFASIDWANGPYLVKTETDPAGGTNYSAPGVFALNSVPYALYAANGTPGPKGDKGDTGATGATGPTGAKGDTGATGLTGPTGPAGATGAAGANGTTGADGKTVRNGTSNPVSGTGMDGDFYINTATNTLFGPKANGAWPSGVALVGPTGATGPQGIQGPTGATGAAGPAPSGTGLVTVTNGSLQTPGALTGDVTTSAGGLTTTIGAGKVTNSMLAGSIDLTSKVTGALPVANGGTGAATLTGYIKGTGTTAMTASASIPVADVLGAAPLASPTFTGIPAAPTATAGTNTTQLATTAFVTSAVSTANATNANGTSFSGGTTGLTPATASTGAVTLAGTLVGANGGTGVNNSGKTITLGGDLTTSGAFATTLVATATTNINLPTSGTLATLAGSETLSNKTFTDINGLTIRRVYSSGNGNIGISPNSNTISSSTTGDGNIIIGANAGMVNTTGSNNITLGTNGLRYNNVGGSNIAVGANAMEKNTSGNQNVAIGQSALYYNQTGSNLTAIGYDAGAPDGSNLTNSTAIGNGARVTTNNTIQLGNTSVTNVNTSGTITAAGLVTTGNVAVNTNKFTVAGATGNTAVAGTLAVTGASTFTGDVTSAGASISGFDAALNDQTGTSYTLTSADNGKVVTLNNSSAITLTINTGLGDGFNCLIVQKGAGQITIAGTATRINRQSHTKTAGQYAVVSIVNIGNEQVIVAGDTGN